MKTLAIPKGTRDYGPEQMRIRKYVIYEMERIFEQFGGVCIDTPVFEMKGNLVNNCEEETKLIFDLAQQNKQQYALRYDLTVPFARYVAMNGITNMKRYQIGKVYRRDNPVMTKGRYREFLQCDFDIAGSGPKMANDAIIIKVMVTVLKKFDLKFKVKLNYKPLLDELLKLSEVDAAKISSTCSTLDKLDKCTWNEIARELSGKGLTEKNIEAIFALFQYKGAAGVILSKIREDFPAQTLLGKHVDDLLMLVDYLSDLDCLGDIEFDVSLCRGLNYYTGMLIEAVLSENELGIGSIAGGGRYDNLISEFSGSSVPAVGCSIGIERIFTLLEKRELGLKTQTICYITYIYNRKNLAENQIYRKQVLKLANKLWALAIPTEIVSCETQILKEQIINVAKSGIPYLIVFAETEFKSGAVLVKELATKTQLSMIIDAVPTFIKNLMGGI